MRDVARIGMDGLLLLVDVSDPTTWEDARALADSLLGESLAPMVVGANRWQSANGALGALRSRLGLGDDIPILRCNVVDAQSSRDLVVELLARVLDDLATPRDGPPAVEPACRADDASGRGDASRAGAAEHGEDGQGVRNDPGGAVPAPIGDRRCPAQPRS
jgi:hypothetical protein